MKKYLLSLAVLSLAGAGCAAPTATPAPQAQTPSAEQQQNAEVVPTQPTSPTANVDMEVQDAMKSQEDNALVIHDQPAGDEIFVPYVKLYKQGYLVIHVDENGKPGAIVAESDLLNAGDNVSFYIKYKPQPGRHFIAMLHIDNGNGKWDNATTDKPAVDSKNNIIMTPFVAIDTNAMNDSEMNGGATSDTTGTMMKAEDQTDTGKDENSESNTSDSMMQ